MSRIMGIDYGKSRIGIAISDELEIFATPYKTIKNTSVHEILAKISQIIERENIGAIVIGLPYHQDGSASQQTQEVEKFIRTLKQNFDKKIDTFDESYSTVEANEILIGKGVSIRKSKEKIDQIAAAIILQNYLNNKKK